MTRKINSKEFKGKDTTALKEKRGKIQGNTREANIFDKGQDVPIS